MVYYLGILSTISTQKRRNQHRRCFHVKYKRASAASESRRPAVDPGAAEGGLPADHAPAPDEKRPVGATIAIRFFQVLGTLILIGIVTGAFMACYAMVYVKTVIMPKTDLDLSAIP